MPEMARSNFAIEAAEKLIEVLLLNSLSPDRILMILQATTQLIQNIVKVSNMKWSVIVQNAIENNLDKIETSPMWW
jgi:hypothetical protein